MKYDFKTIEKKWQDRWDSENTFAARDDYSMPKFYALVEFPYPSGQGLHVGHPRSYTALDIVSRKKRHAVTNHHPVLVSAKSESLSGEIYGCAGFSG